ncbi:MAG: hypothetical protein RL414_727 [Actinomycetota bacterium]|jgi:uncharacterized protein YcnI
MKKKVISACVLALSLTLVSTQNASAHVSVQLKGYTDIAGSSSRLWLSLGHGCTYKNMKYGTSVFSVDVPRTAGKPTPEFHFGYKTSVVASKEANAAGVPDFYTVTWTAKSKNYAIDDGTFYDFGLKVTWDAVAQKVNFPTTQICYATTASGVKKPLYLKWTITDGSTKVATEDTEFGPAPSVTTKPKA